MGHNWVQCYKERKVTEHRWEVYESDSAPHSLFSRSRYRKISWGPCGPSQCHSLIPGGISCLALAAPPAPLQPRRTWQSTSWCSTKGKLGKHPQVQSDTDRVVLAGKEEPPILECVAFMRPQEMLGSVVYRYLSVCKLMHTLENLLSVAKLHFIVRNMETCGKVGINSLVEWWITSNSPDN